MNLLYFNLLYLIYYCSTGLERPKSRTLAVILPEFFSLSQTSPNKTQFPDITPAFAGFPHTHTCERKELSKYIRELRLARKTRNQAAWQGYSNDYS